MRELYGKEYGLIQSREIPADYKNKVLKWLNPQTTDVILEIGSGSGDMLDFLESFSPRVIGIDINEILLRIQRRHSTVAADARALPLVDKSFNKTISLHALEHIPDLRKVFSELDRVTVDGGFSFHAFPAERWWRGEGAFREALPLTHNLLKAFFLSRRLHIHSLNPNKIQDLLEGTSWNLVRQEKLYVPIEQGYAWLVLLQK